MRTSRVIALVLGCVLLVPGLLLLAAGLATTGLDRDSGGYLSVELGELASPTAAVTSGTAEVARLRADDPGWLINTVSADLRVRATSTDGRPVFVGVGPVEEVRAYLRGVAHDELARVGAGRDAYRRVGGASRPVGPPSEQTFWAASETGSTAQLEWAVTDGRWVTVLMNADGSTDVAADVTAAVRTPLLGAVTAVLLGTGALLVLVAGALVLVGATGAHGQQVRPVAPVDAASGPVVLTATLDPDLTRWRWLVKWFLAIPHAVLLLFLWPAFAVVTLAAGVMILFTGRYPRGLFAFNEGVLRWSWRVAYYAGNGGIGTDRYPPFSLRSDPGYPADLRIRYPERLRNALVLVKWLLVLPHLLLVGLVTGTGWWLDGTTGADGADGAGISLLSLLVVIAGVALLLTGRYPRSLFDLVVGINRWGYRVIAYAALMTDDYPPFRLDQGGSEPVPSAPPPGPAGRVPAPREDAPAGPAGPAVEQAAPSAGSAQGRPSGRPAGPG